MVLLALVARLTFQGKPITYAYVDSETVSKLQQYGQSALTAPTSAMQDDWLVRGYKLKEFNIKNTWLHDKNLAHSINKLDNGSRFPPFSIILQ